MTSNIFKGLALLALLASCSADETVGLASGHGDNACNAVYMGNPNASGVVAVLASDDTGATFSVMPRLAQRAESDITVTVAVDTETLDAYNKANNLSVSPVSADDITLINSDGKEAKGQITATIKAGDITTVVNGKLSSLSAEKYPYSGRYAVPLKIVKVEGPYKLLSSPQTTIVSLNRKIKTSVLYVKTNSGDHGYTMLMTANPQYTEEMSEWTVQYIAQFNDLSRGNQTTASLRGDRGFYNRISLAQGLQAKTEGRDGDDTWTLKKPNVGEWMHVSYVYRKNGLVGNLTIYVNGEAHRSFVTSLLHPIGADGGWGFGNTNLRNYYLREFRFWNRALTPAEIQDKLYLPEQPDAPGLEAYFPFTRETYDAETRTFRDVAGKWTFQFAPNIRDNKVTLDMDFVDNVVFPAKSLQVEQ
ncbi:MAG: DUF1735 domain-containing protein [Porphyromonas sp.]|nr:DUF1735 domain-containing protein [Porphyromonas sp.]